MKPPILVTGCARSGTSLMAGILHACGAWGGLMSGPNRNNRKGMFENRRVREGVLKPYLWTLGADPLGQDPLPDPAMVADRADSDGPMFRHAFMAEICRQDPPDGPWFYKGAKLCLIWPVVHNAFPNAQWVIVRRPRDAIVDSCLRTSFMAAFKDRQGWAAWVESHVQRFEAMRKAVNAVEVWSNEIVSSPLNHAKILVEKLGLTYCHKAVGEFVSKDLYHQ